LRDPPEANDAEHFVERQGYRSKDLGEATISCAPLHVHLPQPILGMDVPERQHEIMLIGSLNVRYPVPVAGDANRRNQAGDLNGSRRLRERLRELISKKEKRRNCGNEENTDETEDYSRAFTHLKLF
jgi:hypothetical protein